MSEKEQHPLVELIGFYWKTYGGADAVFYSPYFLIASALTVLTLPGWAQMNWWDLPTTILPNVLGFTIAGYAIFLSLGDEKFREAIAGSKASGEPSPYLEIGVSIFHFIVVQVVAILIGSLAKVLERIFCVLPTSCLGDTQRTDAWWALKTIIGWIIAFLGNLTFYYALGCALGAAVLILQLIKSYDESVDLNDK